MIAVIMALYRNPRFRVKHGDETSEFKPQRYGIRQGCPLSPYLFILVMHVMFADIKDRKKDTIAKGIIPGFDFSEILYADDTLLVLRSKESLEALLHEIETESEYYGLRLNRAKCELIEMNGTEHICFKNGEDMTKVQQAKYLGGILTKKADAKTEIQARITATNPVIRSLDVLWKQTIPPKHITKTTPEA